MTKHKHTAATVRNIKTELKAGRKVMAFISGEWRLIENARLPKGLSVEVLLADTKEWRKLFEYEVYQ